IADSGLEQLGGTLISAARIAAAGRVEDAREGVTRLRQAVDYLVDEIGAPKLVEHGQFVEAIESCRKLAKEALSKPDDPVLPVRRKVVEIHALLQKSLSEEYQGSILDLSARSTAF